MSSETTDALHSKEARVSLIPYANNSDADANIRRMNHPAEGATGIPCLSTSLYDIAGHIGILTIGFKNPKVPDKPLTDTPVQMAPLVNEIRSFLLGRPIATLRVIHVSLGSYSIKEILRALPFCGYKFRDGPWEGALVQFGVDPRLKPFCRVYQTLTFKTSLNPIVYFESTSVPGLDTLEFPQFYPPTSRERHMFDGKMFGPTADTWQICDLSDPQLARIAATTDTKLLPTQDTGYFKVATMAKLTVIMYDKLICIRDQWPLHTENEYEVLLVLPDSYQWKKAKKGKRYDLEPKGISTKWQQNLWGKMIRYLYEHSLEVKNKNGNKRGSKRTRGPDESPSSTGM